MLGDLVDDLLLALVAAALRVVDAFLDAFAFLIDDVAQPLGDVFVHTTEVVLLEHLAASLLQPLKHVAQAHHVFAVAVAQALLHHSPQRRIRVAVRREIVHHLFEQGVGVEVEAALGAVPRRVLEPSFLALTTAFPHDRRVPRSPRWDDGPQPRHTRA